MSYVWSYVKYYSGQAELGERPFFCCESFEKVEKPSKKKIVQQNVKGKMADTYNYIFFVHFSLCLWTEFKKHKQERI